jgi:superoxide dismutase, Fe-Mn family
MDALIQALPFDATAVAGLSEKLLTSHHANNYGGAVKRLNAIRAALAELPVASAPNFQLNGLKREELIATNSMLLHELYFDCLGGNGEVPIALKLALAANFGSFERWQDEFVAMSKALGGGSGWVLLTFQPREGTLVNQWAADHTHALAGGIPILALDMYEHAYHMDFGANAGAYVQAFMAAIDWSKVYERFQCAVEAASGHLAAGPEVMNGEPVVLDVRRKRAYEKATATLPGAEWRDPDRVADWCDTVPKDRPVVVYCIYGHEVGRSTALALRAQGVNARFLEGGMDAWQRAGQPTDSKEASA